MIFSRKKDYLFLSFLLIITFSFAHPARADRLADARDFFLDSSYDYFSRAKISAILVFESSQLYFYVDNSLWQNFSQNEKDKAIANLSLLTNDFENKIHPILTSNYGSEWSPGIDNDVKITILFHRLKSGAGGYFNSGNEYSKYEVPSSNEKEMIYLNSDYIESSILKRLLVHEFTHLITFNQKEKINNIEEDIWLNEGRAEYAITLCGYDNIYAGSNLQKRVVEFLKNSSDSLTNWQGFSSDYGILNIFIQYVVDQYGVKILNDSLHSDSRGIESINYALAKNGYKESFKDIFSDWTLAVFFNDCSINPRYCFKNINLKNLRIIPSSIQIVDSVNITVNMSNWSNIWQKIPVAGSNDNLSVKITGIDGNDFRIFYALCDSVDNCKIYRTNDTLEIFVSESNDKYVVVILSMQSVSLDNVLVSLKIAGEKKQENNVTSDLLAKIDILKKQIATLQAELDSIKQEKCIISSDLYFGLLNSAEVSCLQRFLKQQGKEIYPEGLITGNFYTLTRNAVIRFQEKYKDEILNPAALAKGTGYVGIRTKAKINQSVGM